MKLPMLRIAGERPYPPRVSAFTRPFWERLAQGYLTTTGCRSCGRQSFPPKALCPECWSDDVEWIDLPRLGEIYSWTRIHAGPSAFQRLSPYAVAVVDLEHRLRLACPLVTAAHVDPAIGARVEMVVMQFDDGPLFAARVMEQRAPPDGVDVNPDIHT